MRRLAILLLAGICAAAVGPACRKAKQEGAVAPAQDPHITKIWVTKNGDIQLDGKVADLAAVEAALSAVAKVDGVVFYGRDAAREEPHPNAAKVVEMIATRHLPVRISSKPDFSDSVSPGQ